MFCHVYPGFYYDMMLVPYSDFHQGVVINEPRLRILGYVLFRIPLQTPCQLREDIFSQLLVVRLVLVYSRFKIQ